MRLLVCGGRGFAEISQRVRPFMLKAAVTQMADELMLLRTELDSIFLKRKVTVVITGGQKGADQHANERARWHNIKTEVYKADWAKNGKAAGPIRNRRMLEEGKPDLVLAFPGGEGTRNMVEQARQAGIEVIEVRKSAWNG